MEFNDLLTMAGLDPGTVAIAFHKSSTPKARRAICTMADSDPLAFAAFQSTHPAIQQATLASRAFMASFVPAGDGEMTFVGMFRRRCQVPASTAQLAANDDFIRMLCTVNAETPDVARPRVAGFADRLVFDLEPMAELRDFVGRLIVIDPGNRNYMRRAETTHAPVIQITRLPHVAPEMPDWQDLELRAGEIGRLPREWAIRLAQWRGIYLIVDEDDGARYVGSAYGEDNLLGRWKAHVAGEFGVTRELARRRTEGFRFSILELTAPSADISEVVNREHGWMHRLHTIEHGLNR